MSYSRLARTAARTAARVRADLGIGPGECICPYDLAERLGVPVRLVALPSLEGVYSSTPKPLILVSAERPAGRRRFTCAHELGHHSFGHGLRLDELLDEGGAAWTPEEHVAQRFAAALLMPKLVVASAFSRRGWSVAKPTDEQAFIVSQELGVGFTTLITHLETVGGISVRALESLRRTRLPRLRQRVAGFAVAHDLAVLDEHWVRPTMDIEVDDIVLLTGNPSFEGGCALLRCMPAPHLIATAQGVGYVSSDAHDPILIRVSRRGFTGLAQYRHLEVPADE